MAARPDRLDHGAADEDGVHRRLAELGDVEIGLERLVLRAERVAAHHDVEAAERLLPGDRVEHGVGEHDEAGARAVDGHARGDRGLQRRLQAEGASELVHHARLAARDHEAVDLCELLGAPHERHPGAELREHMRVLAEVALERENTDAGAGRSHCPRVE